MIVVRIIGGLGNQMFQYAAGRALAAKFNVPLKLDLRWMARYRHREYLLDRFNLSAEKITLADRMKFTWFPFRRNPPFLFMKTIRRVNHLIYMEPSLTFNPTFFSLEPDCFLFGYFQSYRYFEGCEDLIRHDFSREMDPSIYEKAWVEKVAEPDSIAIQFRRGDFVTDPAANRSIGTCSIDYYEKAVSQIRKKKKDAPLIVFSDNIDWCKANVRFDNTIFIERKGGSPVDDMLLAARCNHIIMANSSFSWWCAWLNRHPDKIVIAPKQWFRDEALNAQTGDLFPPDWIRL